MSNKEEIKLETWWKIKSASDWRNYHPIYGKVVKKYSNIICIRWSNNKETTHSIEDHLINMVQTNPSNSSWRI